MSSPLAETLHEWLRVTMRFSMRNFMRFAKENNYSLPQLNALFRIRHKGACGVSDLGVGVRPILRKNLTAERLAAAIHRAVTDPVMRQRAATLEEKIRAEDGVGQAVGIICQYVGG